MHAHTQHVAHEGYAGRDDGRFIWVKAGGLAVIEEKIDCNGRKEKEDSYGRGAGFYQTGYEI